MARHLLALLFTTALVGCVGDVSTLPPPDDEPETAPTARERFDRDVNQVVETACASCHNNPGTASATPKFTGAAGLTDNYTSLEANGSLTGGWKAANARLITKGVHADGGARAFTAAEIGKITAWLDAEDAERPDGPPDPSAATTPRGALEKFAACATEADFNAANVVLWGNKGTIAGSCYSCHWSAPEGLFASTVSSDMFNVLRHEAFMPDYFTTETVNGSQFRVRANIDKLCSRRNTNGHPGYACGTNDDAAKALIQFVQLTNDKLVNCTATPGFATGPLPF
ncbi:MAG: hypothetical protein KBG48_31780 [Kofleriaceae bacterium]|jgi:cytochrome c553|nr:hypothetical protein [Kofleriaceae bacterium]MBP9172017.1 hypothetical protein [Kofleriaceae bacterium]MBP9862692.1 hypothetical protein [Kofleriaceae bacterium]